MIEGLSKRVGRIISGSMNAMVNAIEDVNPEIVMEQTIREVDGAIDEVRHELGKLIATKHLASKRLGEKNNQHEDLSEKMQVALAQGRDDLAEAAISSQLDIEAQIPVLEATIADAIEQEKALDSYILALQAQKREMQDALRDYRHAQKSVVANDRVSADQTGSIHTKVSQASATFDRVLERNTGIPSDTNANSQTAKQLAELEQLSRKNRIQERLALLKTQTP